MKYFAIDLGTVVFRFFFMMAVIIAAGFSGQWWVAGFGLPILLSIMLGIKFEPRKKVLSKKAKTARVETVLNKGTLAVS